MDATQEFTQILKNFDAGDRDAVDALIPRFYTELENIARQQLRNERPGHTLNTSALVHEAYEKLIGNTRIEWKNRAHFLGVAAISMRRVLINYAKARVADKRGGGQIAVTFEDENVVREARADELVALDEALERLSQQSERQALVVTYAFFGGLKHSEIASALGVSIHTVRKDWQISRAWLRRELAEGSSP